MPIGFALNTTDWWMDWRREELYQALPFATSTALCTVSYGLPQIAHSIMLLVMKYRILARESGFA